MKTIQLSERELSMIFSMLTPPYPVRDTHTDEFNELRNKVFYALRDAKNDEPVSNRDELPEEKGSSLQLRNLIRRRHAEWSDKTFGNVGPIGPLKHLSKEALEAAAEPDDLSEWADMQFLLWDAQRRAGISDGEITAAMEEKLKVNMARQWPEPKDGEPRLHIKEAGNSLVYPDSELRDSVESFLQLLDDYPEQLVPINRNASLVRFMRDALAAPQPQNIPEIIPGWIKCSERVPDEYNYDIWVYSASEGVCHGVAYVGEGEFADDEFQYRVFDATHWMPMVMPAAPKQE